MLDTKRLGREISLRRKQKGLSQEKMAEMLCISPQAISKWENGHTMPETLLLPMLARIFQCTIDELIMPAYEVDEAVEVKATSALEAQAEQIADYVIRKMGNTKAEKIIGLEDAEIMNAVRKTNPNLGYCNITRSKIEKHGRYKSLYITLSSPQKELRLVEKLYNGEDKELFGYDLFSRYTSNVPQIYSIDFEKKILLMEDLNAGVQGCCFDEETENGAFFRENYGLLVKETAKMHAAFWEKEEAFREVGLDWRHETKDNLLIHLNGMEKDFQKYRKKEEAGKIPKVWNGLSNTIDTKKLDYFQDAIRRLKEEYERLVDERFKAGKNITVIHGDLHPGNTFLLRSENSSMKVIDMEAVRMGLCTEDLAMLLALHIEPEKERVKPLLDIYYESLNKIVTGYSYEMFLADYRISVMEAMFFPIRLINHGICDFVMRDRAIRAYETFI